MEAKFRPLPITIVDFAGVLVPGFLCFVLIVTSILLFGAGRHPATPLGAWRQIVAAFHAAAGWSSPVAALLITVVVGYVLKPRAVTFATPLAALWLEFHPRLRK